MAHKRADTLAQIGAWARHLRPYSKRLQARAERAAGRREIQSELDAGQFEIQSELDVDDDGEDVSTCAVPATGAVADLWLLEAEAGAIRTLRRHTRREFEECRALVSSAPVRLLAGAPVEDARRLARAVAACCRTEVVLRGDRVVCIDPKDPARGNQQVVRLLRSGSSLLEEKGRMGSRGVVREQVLGSMLEAERELARRVVSLLADGWLVCEDETEALQAVSARHPELEAEAESDRASAAVLSDWWQEHGDPRGALAAVGIELEDRPTDLELCREEARLVHAHRAHLLGEFAGRVTCGWRRGFIDWLCLERQPWKERRGPIGRPNALWREVLRWLGALPAAARLRGLGVEPDPEGFLRALATSGLPRTIRRLGLGPGAGSDHPVIGPLGPVLGGDLESLEIRGRIISFPVGREVRLRKLALDLCPSDPRLHPLFEELSCQVWPCLEELVIKVGPQCGHFPPELGALLGATASFPSLRRLRVEGIGTAREVVRALLGNDGRPANLEVLELASMDGDPLDEGDCESLARLQRIDLCDCTMPDDLRARLGEQFPNFVLTRRAE